MLEKMNSSTKLATTDRLAIKRKYQSAFFNAVQTLRQEELAKVMASWIQDSRTMLDTNSQTELSTVWQHSFKEKVSVFMPTLSVEQKEYFKEELLALAKDLERL